MGKHKLKSSNFRYSKWKTLCPNCDGTSRHWKLNSAGEGADVPCCECTGGYIDFDPTKKCTLFGCNDGLRKWRYEDGSYVDYPCPSCDETGRVEIDGLQMAFPGDTVIYKGNVHTVQSTWIDEYLGIGETISVNLDDLNGLLLEDAGRTTEYIPICDLELVVSKETMNTPFRQTAKMTWRGND